MHVLTARNVNQAFADGLMHLYHYGVEEPSRNGPVLVAPGPVCTVYERPTERVLFSPVRNANPFFHLMEGLWMLAGHRDVSFPTQFNANFVNYSDDGRNVWGAYGWRWASFFGYDQLPLIIDDLKRNPDSRRAVLSMWNAMADQEYASDAPGGSYADLIVAAAGGKDVPCNTHAYFDRRGPGAALNMTVCCRSNDVVWGAYGANAVHFSMLQEFMAAAIGCPVGVYRQFSNNFHFYTELYPQIATRRTMADLALNCVTTNYYSDAAQDISTTPLVGDIDLRLWLEDLVLFMRDPLDDCNYHSKFFQGVAAPMYVAWTEWKAKRIDHAIEAAGYIVATDWRGACLRWLGRRRGGQVQA